MLTIPEALRPLIVPRSVPDRMVGTFKQVEFAAAVRKSMLAVARRYHPELVDLLLCIRDATWFLAHAKKGRPLDQIRWPSPGQMSAPGGGPPTDGETASDAVGCSIGFERESRSGLNPSGFRQNEAWRSEDTPSQVSADLDPTLVATRRDKAFHHDCTPR